MADIFDRLLRHYGPIGEHRKRVHGYFAFPRLEGEISNRMIFNGKERIVWSLNNYLGLANHPEVRKVDAEASAKWGLAYPMGARMMRPWKKYCKSCLSLEFFMTTKSMTKERGNKG